MVGMAVIVASGTWRQGMDFDQSNTLKPGSILGEARGNFINMHFEGESVVNQYP